MSYILNKYSSSAKGFRLSLLEDWEMHSPTSRKARILTYLSICGGTSAQIFGQNARREFQSVRTKMGMRSLKEFKVERQNPSSLLSGHFAQYP
jgi:hypothetical protein